MSCEWKLNCTNCRCLVQTTETVVGREDKAAIYNKQFQRRWEMASGFQLLIIADSREGAKWAELKVYFGTKFFFHPEYSSVRNCFPESGWTPYFHSHITFTGQGQQHRCQDCTWSFYVVEQWTNFLDKLGLHFHLFQCMLMLLGKNQDYLISLRIKINKNK